MSSDAVTTDAPTVPTLTDVLLDEIAVFRGRPRSVEELSGGLTNRNYKVTTDEGSYVVRVSSEETGALAINRDHEYRNSVIAAAAGVGAPVIAHLPDRHVMVVGFIDGHTFADHDFAVPGTIERVAASCRALHAAPPFVNDFNMFEIQRRYLGVVQENGYRLPDGYLDLEPHVATLRRALAVRDEGTVPCNNDLLAANFIDDGSKIWLIDYEYSGNNDPCFELGNIWSECHLDLDQLEALVTAYYGRLLRNKLARAQLQGLMSKYGWTLWASIQQATSPIDFDFWSWGMEKYESAVAIFRSARFDELLDEVQRAD
ncbi:phosphotransferase family protein [Planosporangium thailandense]|uniref:Phosphotransferase family protein n=1 Tax=Planosporangium thailandense TaxID=765197 RepID=A0ABX0XTT5_9ACTN|nr:choline/ethanolamine kinase family protein [Planosporangium thailandense]NJC68644.1 phosphotransferase family protein [Planosporangium thailandense]